MSLNIAFRSLRIYTRTFHSSAPRAVVYPNANLETFSKAIAAKDRITVVDFHADWCGPCHQLAPVLENLTNVPNKSASGLPFDLVKLDIDTQDGLAVGGQYKVRALPTVIAFRNGSIISQFVGAISEADIKKFLDEL